MRVMIYLFLHLHTETYIDRYITGSKNVPNMRLWNTCPFWIVPSLCYIMCRKIPCLLVCIVVAYRASCAICILSIFFIVSCLLLYIYIYIIWKHDCFTFDIKKYIHFIIDFKNDSSSVYGSYITKYNYDDFTNELPTTKFWC